MDYGNWVKNKAIAFSDLTNSFSVVARVMCVRPDDDSIAVDIHIPYITGWEDDHSCLVFYGDDCKLVGGLQADDLVTISGTLSNSGVCGNCLNITVKTVTKYEGE